MYSYTFCKKRFWFVANKINFYEKGNLTRYLLPKNIVFKRRLNHSQRFSNVKSGNFEYTEADELRALEKRCSVLSAVPRTDQAAVTARKSGNAFRFRRNSRHIPKARFRIGVIHYRLLHPSRNDSNTVKQGYCFPPTAADQSSFTLFYFI